MDTISYNTAKELLFKKQVGRDDLQEVKNLFDIEEELFSQRQLSLVRSIKDLIELLEVYDLCNESNISGLLDICTVLGDSSLMRHLRGYKEVKLIGGENEYALERITSDDREKQQLEESINVQAAAKNRILDNERTAAPTVHRPPTVMREETKKTIYRLIHENIGRKWREFGRELGVIHGLMDEIANQTDKVYVILETFESSPTRQPNRFVFDICDALEQVRMKHLAKDIQNIIANNS